MAVFLCLIQVNETKKVKKMQFFNFRLKAKPREYKIFKIFLTTLVIVLFIPSEILATGTWTGEVSTDWSDAANWSGTPPGPSTSEHDMLIPTSPSGGIFPILSSGTYSIKKLAIKSGASFTQSGGTLSLNDNLEIEKDPAGIYNQTGGTLQMKKDWANVGIFNSTGGTVLFSPVADGGAFEKGSNQFFNIEIDDGVRPNFDNKDGNNIKIAGSFVNNNPSFDMSSNATFTFNGSGDQTISSASDPLPETNTFYNLVIDKPSGTIQLSSNLAVETFTETNGTLDLNGNILWVGTNPLPVELSSFSAVILENGVKLKWRTETEVSNYGFEILRSTQNDNWILLGFVEGHGNSNSPKDYSFIDGNVTAGNYSYRLKQLDTDGQFEYSKIIEIDLGSPQEFELSQNYPNPFNPSTTIRFSVLESSAINLSIFNFLGEKIEDLVNEVKEPGIHTVEFNADNLPSGTYIYRINTNNYTQTKKMILIK